MIGTGTFGCGSTIVEGEDFIAENITFENSSPEVKLFLQFLVSFDSRMHLLIAFHFSCVFQHMGFGDVEICSVFLLFYWVVVPFL